MYSIRRCLRQNIHAFLHFCSNCCCATVRQSKVCRSFLKAKSHKQECQTKRPCEDVKNERALTTDTFVLCLFLPFSSSGWIYPFISSCNNARFALTQLNFDHNARCGVLHVDPACTLPVESFRVFEESPSQIRVILILIWFGRNRILQCLCPSLSLSPYNCVISRR